MTAERSEIEALIEKVRQALQDRNLRRVAKATGLHHNTLHNFMKGSNRPSVQTLNTLLSYLFPA